MFSTISKLASEMQHDILYKPPEIKCKLQLLPPRLKRRMDQKWPNNKSQLNSCNCSLEGTKWQNAQERIEDQHWLMKRRQEFIVVKRKIKNSVEQLRMMRPDIPCKITRMREQNTEHPAQLRRDLPQAAREEPSAGLCWNERELSWRPRCRNWQAREKRLYYIQPRFHQVVQDIDDVEASRANDPWPQTGVIPIPPTILADTESRLHQSKHVNHNITHRESQQLPEDPFLPPGQAEPAHTSADDARDNPSLTAGWQPFVHCDCCWQTIWHGAAQLRRTHCLEMQHFRGK